MSNYNISEWSEMGCCIYQPRLWCSNKDVKITEAYKNPGLFFAHTTHPYGLAPCHLHPRTQDEGKCPLWTVPAIFQGEKGDGRAKPGP